MPAGRPASGCLRAVRIMHGWMDRCLRALVGAGDGWSPLPPPACHSPESRRRVPGEIHTRRRPKRRQGRHRIRVTPPRPAGHHLHLQQGQRTMPPTLYAPSVFYVTGPPPNATIKFVATLFSHNNSHLNKKERNPQIA